METVEDDCGISLDDGTARLIAGWSCDACTLRNEPTANRCVACNRLHRTAGQVRNSSGFVVVLPPDRGETVSKKRRLQKNPPDAETPCASTSELFASGTHVFSEPGGNEDSWVCPACTLLNPGHITRCWACTGVRWALPGRSVAAAALRADRRKIRPNTDDADLVGSGGIRREVGPGGTWTALPPAPEGHLERSCAADDGLDMFASVAGGSELVHAEADAKDGMTFDRTQTHCWDGVARPQWGSGDGPLFPSLQVQPCRESNGGAVEFDDSLARLSLMGFDPTKCHLALEAANGDERLARDFLTREV